MAGPCIGRLTSGGIVVNYYCSSRCGHCLYRSSPQRDKAYMTPQTLAPMLKKVTELGCESMHIGGGEPCLDENGLVAVLKTAAQANVSIDYVETNSSWFKDEKSAGKTLRRLMDHGCKTLLVSISPFHNEFVPFEKVRGLIAACSATGMGIFPWTMEYLSEIGDLDQGQPHMLGEYKNIFGEGFVRQMRLRYGVHMNGRALDTFRGEMPGEPAEDILLQTILPCDEMWQSAHFHIDLYGKYIPTACVGMGIDCADVGEPLDENKYPWMSLLSEQGLRGLYMTASSEHGFVQRPRYLNKCDLCQDIRRHLVMERNITSSDLHPRGYYEEAQIEREAAARQK